MFKTTTLGYREQVEGTWGEFRTPTGRVTFLQTKARLGTSGVDLERRLTSYLRPVREVIPAEKLDFNQLLQRDLDDHRVIEDLIPYLLKRKDVEVGPSFFPPIMAVLLPFGAANAPIDNFPAVDFNGNVKDPDLGVDFQEVRFGSAYRVQRLIEPDGTIHRIRLGRLHWNEEQAKLVVIDGQHRAMALLAIDRTVNGTWEKSGGGMYQHFYEAGINKLLKERASLDLDAIEVPVTVCWFPDLGGPGRDPHKAARKLFVDVNKEARAPSDSRITLLSETELLNILTRNLLNRLRQPSPPLPLYAVEYDNPDTDKEAAKSVKWTVLTNLFLLRHAVQRCVFGPAETLLSMRSSAGLPGRPNQRQADKYMREQLATAELFPEVIPDGEGSILRSDIGDRVFPHSQVQLIVDRFMDWWGEAILTVLGEVSPYAAHGRALTALRDTWATKGEMERLASDALFDGVGLYWTISTSQKAWASKCEEARSAKMAEPIMTDIVRVWGIILEKSKPFGRLRAREYLGLKKDLPDGDEESNSTLLKNLAVFYRTVNTNACQLGAILSFAGVYHRAKKPGVTHVGVAKTLVRAWNAALASPRTKTESRHLVFAPKSVIEKPLNRLPKLDTPFATYFRYFWLQLLSLDEARTELEQHVDLGALDGMIEEARSHYAQFLVVEQEKAERAAAEADVTKEQVTERARKKIAKDLSESLNHWFGLKVDDARKIADAAVMKVKGSSGSTASSSEPENTAASEEAPAEETSAGAEDIESILQEVPDE